MPSRHSPPKPICAQLSSLFVVDVVRKEPPHKIQRVGPHPQRRSRFLSVLARPSRHKALTNKASASYCSPHATINGRSAPPCGSPRGLIFRGEAILSLTAGVFFCREEVDFLHLASSRQFSSGFVLPLLVCWNLVYKLTLVSHPPIAGPPFPFSHKCVSSESPKQWTTSTSRHPGPAVG